MMKKIIVSIAAVLIFASISLGLAANSRAAQNAAIVKDEVILPRGPGEHMEVRHIVLKGTNEEIGRAMGELAQKDYSIRLNKYAEPAYAKARVEYMRRNAPIFFERMKGIARAYGVSSLSDTLLDTSDLPLFSVPQCSGLLIPAAYSANGHTFYSSSRDYYVATFSEVMGQKPKQGEKKIFSEAAVVEMYPDKGYPTLAATMGGLVAGADTVNSEGLSVSVYEDDTFGVARVQKDASHAAGLSMQQVVMLIAGTCATLDEARETLLNNKISMQVLPMHMQISDKTGRAFIYEISPDDFSEHFVYNDGKPQPITNHGVYAYPDLNKMPVNKKDSYDTYNRYRRLVEFISSHKGGYTVDDGWKAMNLVVGSVPEASEAGHHNLPLRTFYQAVVDNEDRMIKVRYYLKDGAENPATGNPELVFSKIFEFQLKRHL